MKYCVGIDLGSTTTKAVILGEDAGVLGRGITNSRSNYEIACAVSLSEALINARFALLDSEMKNRGVSEQEREQQLHQLSHRFRKHQYLAQLSSLGTVLLEFASAPDRDPALKGCLESILEKMAAEADDLYKEGAERKSDFFRDLAGSRYLELADTVAQDESIPFDQFAGLYDKAILQVENMPSAASSFGEHIRSALDELENASAELTASAQTVGAIELEKASSVGTGYGRQTLPFPKEQIRSEILCHGLGAHKMFPETRTVLDIGGQDTKAIQVDGSGIVTSFQMNDRCAAGCGRYLGYIADEMNLGLHELGPLACNSTRTVKINSTCTVFAGAELRERLSLGEKREDILAGLHRAIILRAMSLLARSGGIFDEFTFTGGVAKNPAAVDALRLLVQENYGDRIMNISPQSIYTGALGAALFAHRDWERDNRATAA